MMGMESLLAQWMDGFGWEFVLGVMGVVLGIVGLLVLFVVTLRVILRGDKTPNELPPVRHQEPRGFPLD
jgi:hypothetical protein